MRRSLRRGICRLWLKQKENSVHSIPITQPIESVDAKNAPILKFSSLYDALINCGLLQKVLRERTMFREISKK